METRGTEADTIRAVLRDGVIQPLDPLPPGWAEGQELWILAPEPSDDPEQIEAWSRETDALAKELSDPQEITEIEAALAEADRHAKAQVRREMGLE